MKLVGTLVGTSIILGLLTPAAFASSSGRSEQQAYVAGIGAAPRVTVLGLSAGGGSGGPTVIVMGEHIGDISFSTLRTDRTAVVSITDRAAGSVGGHIYQRRNNGTFAQLGAFCGKSKRVRLALSGRPLVVSVGNGRCGNGLAIAGTVSVNLRS